jgi:hypothetical protein
MSETRKDVGMPASRDESTVRTRQEWQRPEWFKLEGSDAQVSANANTDGVIES